MTERLSKGEIAKRYFESGYNCSQSILLAFGEETGLDPAMAARLSSSFGGGMARLREVCGSVSGIFMVAGLLYGYDDPRDYEGKKEHYARIQELAGTFRSQNGSIVCRELLGLDHRQDEAAPSRRTEEYYRKRPCGELIRQAGDIMEAYLKAHPVSTEDEAGKELK